MDKLIAAFLDFVELNAMLLRSPKKKDSAGFMHWNPSPSLNILSLEQVAGPLDYVVIDTPAGQYEGKQLPRHLYIGPMKPGLTREEQAQLIRSKFKMTDSSE